MASMEPARRKEEIAAVIAALAADVDAVATRSSNAVRRLEALHAEPNAVVAARRAVSGLADVASALRREGLLRQDQQKLL